jgi:hypothetical protein
MRPQPTGHSLDALRQLAIAPRLAVVADRPLMRQAPRNIKEQRCQVHENLALRKSSRRCRLAVLGQ